MLKKNIKRTPIGKKNSSSHDGSEKHAHKHVHKSQGREKSSWFFYLAIVALIIFSGFYFLYQERGFDPVNSIREMFRERGPVAATVNGQRIYLSEVEEYFTRIPEPLRAELTKRVVLDQIITQEVLVQDAQRKRITVTERELDALVSEAISRSGWTPDQFNQVLTAQGMTMRDLKDLYRVSVLIEKLINHSVLSGVEVTDEEIEEFYNANQDMFRVATDQVRAEHILIRVSPETRNETEAFEIAQDVAQRAIDGENFTSLVMEFSEDPTILQNSGDLGYFSRGVMISDFEDVAFSLSISEISNPVRTELGYHIIKVTDRRFEGDLLPLSESRQRIRENLLGQRQQVAVEAFIIELRENANIVVFEDVLRSSDVLDELDDSDMENVVDDVEENDLDVSDFVDDILDDEDFVGESVLVFEFNADGFNFVRDGVYNPTIIVTQGDTVRIEFTNDDSMPHDWVIDEFNARTEVLRTGESESIEFVADTVGEFEYYCSVGQHRANGMFGILIVEELEV